MSKNITQRIKIILIAVILITSSSQLSFAFDSPFIIDADSIIYENDSVFTIESVQNELLKDGEWIKVSKDEVDPDGVTESDGFDDEINTDYVWRPRNMEEGWSPYSNGYWRYTNCGWMWASYYSWGWRTCHYGRWWWSNKWGWVWSPGFVWGPAWVVWMYDDGYCGWYPVSPRVRCHRYYGYRCHKMRYRVRNWRFCEKKDFTVHIPPRQISDPMFNPNNIIKTATFDGVINVKDDIVNNNGPKVTDIENTTGKKIIPVNVDKMNNTKRINGTGKEDKDIKKVDDRNYEVKQPEKRNDNNTERKTDERKYEDKRKDDGYKDKEVTKERTKEPTKERTYEEPRKESPKEYPKEKPKDDYTRERKEQKEYKEPEKKHENRDREPRTKDDNPPKKDEGNKMEDNGNKGRR